MVPTALRLVFCCQTAVDDRQKEGRKREAMEEQEKQSEAAAAWGQYWREGKERMRRRVQKRAKRCEKKGGNASGVGVVSTIEKREREALFLLLLSLSLSLCLFFYLFIFCFYFDLLF